MRVFSVEEIEKYYEYTIELIGNEEDIAGRCGVCGRELDKLELPKGPEKKVVCLKDRDYFVVSFEELEGWGDL